MDKEQGRPPEGAPERAQHAGAGAPLGADASTPQRFSAAGKMAAVTRLLRGEPLEVVARELNVTVARLNEWRERALAGAAAAMKERERDERDAEIARRKAPAGRPPPEGPRRKAKVGEITMANELLEEKIAALEGKRPLARRRSRR